MVDRVRYRTKLRDHVVADVGHCSRPAPVIDDLNIQAEKCVCIDACGQSCNAQAVDMRQVWQHRGWRWDDYNGLRPE